MRELLTEWLHENFDYLLSNIAIPAAAATTILIIGLIASIISLAITVLLLVANWQIFTKAGEEGWKSLIPFYNSYILWKIVTGEGLFFLSVFASAIPYVGAAVVVGFNVYRNAMLARSFGKDSAIYTVGLILLPVIFIPVIAFSNAIYIGPKGIPRAYVDA